jgi:outer membrane lipoprotein
MISFQELIKNPEGYKGKVMLLGGQILATNVREGETWLEALQRPLNWQKRPEDDDQPGGRFLVRFADFRDPVIYSPRSKSRSWGKCRGKRYWPLKEPIILIPC